MRVCVWGCESATRCAPAGQCGRKNIIMSRNGFAVSDKHLRSGCCTSHCTALKHTLVSILTNRSAHHLRLKRTLPQSAVLADGYL